jgi:hypothetical protein
MSEDTSFSAIKLPSFWCEQPTVWFNHIEALFFLKKITDDSAKYYHVVASLDQATATRLMDTLSNPPRNGKYDGLKTRLEKTYGLTRRDRASRLLHIRGLGDRKPSELMDEMLALLAGHELCLLFEEIFLEKMPEDIRIQLVNEDFTNPRQVAELADKMWASRSSTFLHKVVKPNNGSKSALCYYHERFGTKATKCQLPCSFAGNGQADRLNRH